MSNEYNNDSPGVRTTLRTAGVVLVSGGAAALLAGEYVVGGVCCAVGIGLFYLKDYVFG